MDAVLEGRKKVVLFSWGKKISEDNLLLYLIICINTRKHILCHSDQIRFCLVVFFPLGTTVQYILQDKKPACVSLFKKKGKKGGIGFKHISYL